MGGVVRLAVDLALNLAVDKDVRVVEVGPGDQEVDDLVVVSLLRLALELLLQVGLDALQQLVDGLHALLVEGGDELVVQVREDLPLHFLEVHHVGDVLPGELLAREVGVQVELDRVLADLEAHETVDEAGERDHLALADRELGVLFLVLVLVVLDLHLHVRADVVVPLNGALNGLEDRELPADRLDRLVHVLLADGDFLARHAERLVVAEVDLGPHGDDRLHHQRLGRLKVELGLVDGVDLLGLQGLVVDLGHEFFEGLLEDGGAAEALLDHPPGGLAGPEPGDLDLLRDARDRLLHVLLDQVRIDLDLHGDTRAGETFSRNCQGSGLARMGLRHARPDVSQGDSTYVWAVSIRRGSVARTPGAAATLRASRRLYQHVCFA